jgi:hypothetical protein
MSTKKPQQDMAMRLLKGFKVFVKTDKDINLRGRNGTISA